MFRRRWFSSPKTERRYFFSTNQGSCDIYADGVYVGRSWHGYHGVHVLNEQELYKYKFGRYQPTGSSL